MITWPAIIKYAGDHELVYVADAGEWDVSVELDGYHFNSDDQLIDSSGVIFDLSNTVTLSQKSSEKEMGLDEVTELVRHHASELGNCCISKLIFPSIAEAVRGVDSIKDEH